MPRTWHRATSSAADDRRDSRGPRRRCAQDHIDRISSTGSRVIKERLPVSRDRENIRRVDVNKDPIPVLPTCTTTWRHPVQRAWRGHFTRAARGRRSGLMAVARRPVSRCMAEPLGSNSLLDWWYSARSGAALRARGAEGYGAPRFKPTPSPGACPLGQAASCQGLAAHGDVRLTCSASCKATPRYFAPANP